MKTKVLVVLTLLAVLLVPSMACGGHGAPELVFAVFGDSRSNMMSPPISSRLDEVLGRVSETNTSFCIHTGDFYKGAPGNEEDSKWQANLFLKKMERLEIPWYPVMGGHEAEDEGWTVCQELVFEAKPTYYSFDVDNCHFIILDAYMPDAWSSLSQEQMAWLESDLENTRQPHVFVFLHPPLYATGSHMGESFDTDAEVRNQLATLLVRHGVDAVFCGHEHLYSSLRYKGLIQIVTGGAGAPLHKPLPKEVFSHLAELSRYVALATYHYVVVQVKGKEVSIAAYDLEGDVIDKFKIVSKP